MARENSTAKIRKVFLPKCSIDNIPANQSNKIQVGTIYRLKL
jgi:hypothetical protein